MRRFSKNRYQPYRTKKIKLPWRIVTVVAAALIIFVVTVAVGNGLKNKLSNTEIDTSDIITTPDTTAKPVSNANVKEHDSALLKVKSGFVNINGYTDTYDVEDKVYTLVNNYNSLTIVAINSAGKVTYQSPAVSESSGLAPSSSLIPFENVKAAIKEAKESKMRVSAVVNFQSPSSKLVVKELAENGIDEVLLTYNNLEALDEASSASILSVLKSFSENYNVCVGVSFAPAIYTDVKNTPLLERVYDAADFLAVDFSARSASEIKDILDTISGCINGYMLRPVLSGSDLKAVGEINKVMNDYNLVAREYISAPAEKTED